MSKAEKDLERLTQVFRTFAAAQAENGEDGFIEFNHDQIMATDSHFTGRPQISIAITTLKDRGLIRMERRGAPGILSKWDVRPLLNGGTSTVVPQTPVGPLPESSDVYFQSDAVVEEVTATVEEQTKASVKIPVAENGQKLDLIQSSLVEMISFIRQLPEQMVGHLQDLSKDLDMADARKVNALIDHNAQLQKEVSDASEQLEIKSIELDERDAAIAALNAQVQELKTKLELGSERQIRTHYVVRCINKVRDEFERFASAEPWKQRNMGENSRRTIDSALREILRELGTDSYEEISS